MARRPQARDRGRASHAHDDGPGVSTRPIAVSIRPARCLSARRHGRLCGQCRSRGPARYALGLLEPDDAAIGAHRSRCRRRTGADAGVRVARIVQPARHAQRRRWSSTPRARCRARPTCWQARGTGRSSACSTSMTASSAANASCMRTGWTSPPRRRLDTDYAAGFWTNRSEHPNAKGRVRLGIPRDAFFASGDLGQRIVIMPSQRLVVVRLGDSVDPTGDITRRRPAGEGSDRGGAAVKTRQRPTTYGPPFSSARA